MKIGFLDSGIGGLTVLNEAIKRIPDHEYLYYADSDHAPYGTRSTEEIIELTDAAVSFLIQKGAEIIVVACNTATSAAIAYLREKYSFPIIGMEPAIKPALSQSRSGKILLTATENTLREKKLNDLIHKLDAKDRVISLSLQFLVQHAEQNDFDSPELKEKLKKIFLELDLSEVDILVLGCTHFIFFKPLIRSFIPSSITIIDGNTGTVKNLMNQIPENKKSKQSLSCFLSGSTIDSTKFLNLIELLD